MTRRRRPAHGSTAPDRGHGGGGDHPRSAVPRRRPRRPRDAPGARRPGSAWPLDALVAAIALRGAHLASRKARDRRSRRAWPFQTLMPAAWLAAPLAWLVGLPETVADVGPRRSDRAIAVSWWFASRVGETLPRVRMAVDGAIGACAVLVAGWAPAFDEAWHRAGGGASGCGRSRPAPGRRVGRRLRGGDGLDRAPRPAPRHAGALRRGPRARRRFRHLLLARRRALVGRRVGGAPARDPRLRRDVAARPGWSTTHRGPGVRAVPPRRSRRRRPHLQGFDGAVSAPGDRRCDRDRLAPGGAPARDPAGEPQPRAPPRGHRTAAASPGDARLADRPARPGRAVGAPRGRRGATPRTDTVPVAIAFLDLDGFKAVNDTTVTPPATPCSSRCRGGCGTCSPRTAVTRWPYG